MVHRWTIHSSAESGRFLNLDKLLKMDRPQLSKFACFWILMLAINTWVLAQQPKPSYVLKHIWGREAYEDDPFLRKIPQYMLMALNNLAQVDVSSSYTHTTYPAQYYLEVIPSYLHHISNSYYGFYRLDPKERKMYFEYRMDYGPKITLILGDIVTGRVLDVHELKTTSKLESEIIGFSYDEIGYKAGGSLESVDIQKYTETTQPMMKQVLKVKTIKAEIVLRNELYQIASAVQLHFFPTRAKLLELKPMRRDTVTAEIEAIDGYQWNRFHTFYVYLLKEFKDSIDTYERIEPLANLTTTPKKNTFVRGYFPKPENNIIDALSQRQTVWYSPIRLKYQSYQHLIPPSVAFNIRTSGVDIDPNMMDKLYQSLKVQLLNVRGKNIVVLDREKVKAIQWQQQLNKSGSYLDKPWVEQYKSIGARYILDVEIKSVKPEYKSDSRSFAFTCVYLLRFIDVETNEIVSEVRNEDVNTWSSIKIDNYLPSLEYEMMYKLKNKAQADFIQYLGLSYIKFNLREIINRTLPAKIVVRELTEVSKGKVKEIFISGNFNEKTEKDDYHVCIKKEIIVDGQMDIRWEQIGRIALETAVGDGLALARVKKGEAEIYAAFQKGEKLYCFDRPEWLIDGNYKWQLKKAGF